MATTLSTDFSTIVRSFGAFAELSPLEKDVLKKTIGASHLHPAGAQLVSPGQPTDKPRLILSGWAYSSVTFPDGRRQIIDFRLPGDLIALCSRPGAKAHAACFALTPLVTASAHTFLSMARDQPLDYPGFAKILLALEEQHEKQRIVQIIRLGRQAARERMASLILELYVRLEHCGLQKGGVFQMPVTQEILGDALGLSTVHVNRTLQDLRRENLIRTAHGRVEILDLHGLSAIAGHDRS